MRISKKKKIKLAANIIKASIVIIISSAAIEQVNPYIIVALSVLGGVADKVVSFIKELDNDQK